MGMELGHVRTALPAEKLYLSKNFRVVVFRREGTIAVLLIMCCYQDIFGDFDKMFVVATLLASKTPGRLTGRNMDLFHSKQSVRLKLTGSLTARAVSRIHSVKEKTG